MSNVSISIVLARSSSSPSSSSRLSCNCCNNSHLHTFAISTKLVHIMQIHKKNIMGSLFFLELTNFVIFSKKKLRFFGGNFLFFQLKFNYLVLLFCWKKSPNFWYHKIVKKKKKKKKGALMGEQVFFLNFVM
jgi:hypothetical protein